MGSESSDRPSPSRDPENPIPRASPPPEKSVPPKVASPARVGEPIPPSPVLSPLRKTDGPNAQLQPLPPLPPPPQSTPDHLPPLPPVPAAETHVASRMARDDQVVVTKAIGGGGDDVRGVIGGEGGSAARRSERGLAFLSSLRWGKVATAAVGLRVSATALCLIAFSVMSADKTEGWDGDSYDRYEQYRYLVGVNVIGFVYSGSQVCATLHRMISKKHIVDPAMRYYFDLFMDQILAYLVMSASSSAASINDIWVSRFGGDNFTRMVNASVSISFLAFIALALTSVISAHNLFRLLS